MRLTAAVSEHLAGIGCDDLGDAARSRAGRLAASVGSGPASMPPALFALAEGRVAGAV